MMIKAITSLLPGIFQPGNKVNSTTTNRFSAAPAQSDSPSISPAASFLNMLQQIQQQDPTLFQKITSQIATRLQNEAKTATAQGNSTQAAQLNQLATEFQNASTTGQLPSAQALQQAGLGGHHGHHGHHHGGGSSTANNDTQSLLNSILSSSTSSTTTT